MKPRADVDHLVVAARTLDEGVQWCEAALGVLPGPGGAHPLMGTHNRLLAIGSPAHPRSYLEIIAIDPAARPTRGPREQRWFDLDDGALQDALARRGPRLIHFVARVRDALTTVNALAEAPLGIDRGEVIEASRDTAAGRLEWQISVRPDGQRLFYGLLPTVIQWGAVHPCDSMAPSPIALEGIGASHPRPETLQAALRAIGLAAPRVGRGPPNLVATLHTSKGLVQLESRGV